MSTTSTPAWHTDSTAFVSTEYDYLVVGGGTAGLALAARLAEDGKYKVGVIDAGAYRPDEPLINVPAYWGRLLADTSFSWQFMSAPQQHAAERSIYLASGKVLGGSSATNLMAYMRANKIDYDNWEALGNPGWNWEGMLPYFRKAETFSTPAPEELFPGNPPSQAQAKEFEHTYHGANGPLPVTYNATYHPAFKLIVQTLNNLGIATNYAPESGDATGVFNVPRTVDQVKKVRAYSATTYLASVGNHGNISVVTEAQASKVVFKESPAGLIATGVEFVSKGQTFKASAKKEVILSAGAFQSPQLLELSGIGDAKRLSALDIPCLVDLPQVGENYQDHVGVVNAFELAADAPDASIIASDPSFSVSCFTFFPLQKIIPEAEFAAMVKRLDDAFSAATTTPLQKAQFKLQRKALLDPHAGAGEILFVPGQPMNGKNFMNMLAASQYLYSRGHVHISTKDPLTKPTVDPRFFEINWDTEVLTKISRFCLKLVGTEPVKPIIAGRVLPAPTVEEDKAYEEFIWEKFQTVFHAAGTAAMAPRELGGVVDPTLKVYGTCNLRVCDASIIPLHIAAHPQATVYAIAEKAADIIKAAQ